jgi:hypothetical protein
VIDAAANICSPDGWLRGHFLNDAVPRPVGAPQLDDRTGHDYAGLDVSAMGIEAFMPQPG